MIDYPDTCNISRSAGEVNEEFDEITTELYAGACDIQYGGNGNTSFQSTNWQSQPILFIPNDTILFRINDIVIVHSANGRISNYTIEQFESSLEFNDTCIWLKGGVDV